MCSFYNIKEYRGKNDVNTSLNEREKDIENKDKVK